MILDYYAHPLEVGTRVAVRDGGTLKIGTIREVRVKGGKVQLDDRRHLIRMGDRYEMRTDRESPVMNVRDLRSLIAI